MASNHNKNPSYMSRHPLETIRTAQVAGEAAAGRLSNDLPPLADFITRHKTYNAADLAEMYHQDALIVNELKRPHKRTWGDILGL